MGSPNVSINFADLAAQVDNMSVEDIRKAVVELRTKQRVQQKKYHNKEGAKSYQQKRAALNKALAAKAKELGIYDSIKEEAARRADEILASEAAEAETVEAEETE